MRPCLLAAALLLWPASACAALRTRTVEYKQGKTVLQGYLAFDDSATGKRPGVLVIHEWMGLNDYAKRRAEQLAGLGYVAFAADIYGKGVRPANMQQAGEQAKIYRDDRALLRARAAAGLDTLRKQEHVDPQRLAAIGYCFGGTAVLELARSGAKISGVVSFHGGLATPRPEDARQIGAKVLALHGADDPHVPAKELAAFEEEMRRAKVDWQLNIYGGAVHSFSNPASGNDPSKGIAYNARADRRSWDAMKLFFGEIFGQPKQ